MGGPAPIGRSWPEHRYEVAREKIREYASAIGLDLPWHRDQDAARELGFEAVVAPPTFAAVYVAPAVSSVMFDPAVGVFDPEIGLAGYRFVQRSQQLEWGVPVCSGDTISTVATLLEAGSRHGSEYRVFGSTSTNGAGEVVVRGRYEGVVAGGGKRRPREATPAPDPGDPRRLVAGRLEAGEGLPALTVETDRITAIRYAGASGDFTPFHLDPDLARALGFADVILHGLYTFAILARSIYEPLGGDPRALRSLAASFRRPAVAAKSLRTQARVTAAEPDRYELECAVLQEGRAVLDRGRAILAPRFVSK